MIPVLTQPCTESTLIPIGAFTADGEWNGTFGEQFDTMVEAMAAKAAELGADRAYNLHWKTGSHHGHTWLIGTADAYRLADR